MTDTKDVASHFRFGENWAAFAASITEDNVARAVDSLTRILPRDLLAGRELLDIGSGSGLSAVAALRLGARHVTAIDIDRDSVATSRAVLERFAAPQTFTVSEASVFDLAARNFATFDVVHSWGVLHHTGDLVGALTAAAQHVRNEGTFAVALYRRTPMDAFWVSEKRIYTAGSNSLQKGIRGVFKASYLAGLIATGRNPARYLREYRTERGMNWSHDVHDWLGGYPYEAIEAAELEALLAAQGFQLEHAVERPVQVFGLLGAPCNEYRFSRRG